MAGFASGECSFKIGLHKSATKLGYTVYLRFQISQHVRDIKLIESFVSYLGCGTIVNESEHVKFQVAKFKDIWEKVIPFFQKNPILGNKHMDYMDWCRAAKIINTRGHLTQEGFDLILEIKDGINRGR